MTAILAVVSLVLAVLLVTGGAGGQVGSSARSSAAAACDLVQQVPADGVDMGADEDLAWITVYRLRGAAHLAEMAGEMDDGYRSFAGALGQPSRVYTETFSMEGPEFVEALQDAHAAC
ncbi:MAG TPA: hypothetical protein VK063_08725 [Beutenbergiaceae bacterium]|nr:hypothetical protein [Beutenbergiaceae bacterium]